MNITNTKIKRLIRESLQRILFESEDIRRRIQQLKDREALLFSKRIAEENAGNYKEAQDLTQELEMIKKEYESLETKKAKPVKEREPSEFDKMFVDIDTSKQVVPHKQKPSRRGFFSNLFNREDTPSLEAPEEMAMFDVTPGSSDLELQDMARQPMTAEEKQQAVNRRSFLQGLGASAVLGTQIFDFYKETAYEDFMMMSEAEKIEFIRSFVYYELQKMPGALEFARTVAGAAEDIIHEIIEKIIQHLLKVKNVEDNPLYDDLYEILEDPVADYFDELVAKSKDPRLKIASDWFDRSFSDGTWHSMYDHNFKTWTDNALINVDKDFNSMSPDEKLEYIRTYLMDYNPEGWNESLITEFEMLGHRDPGETGEMDVYNQLDKLIKQKIKDHYTPNKIKELRDR